MLFLHDTQYRNAVREGEGGCTFRFRSCSAYTHVRIQFGVYPTVFFSPPPQVCHQWMSDNQIYDIPVVFCMWPESMAVCFGWAFNRAKCISHSFLFLDSFLFLLASEWKSSYWNICQDRVERLRIDGHQWHDRWHILLHKTRHTHAKRMRHRPYTSYRMHPFAPHRQRWRLRYSIVERRTYAILWTAALWPRLEWRAHPNDAGIIKPSSGRHTRDADNYLTLWATVVSCERQEWMIS